MQNHEFYFHVHVPYRCGFKPTPVYKPAPINCLRANLHLQSHQNIIHFPNFTPMLKSNLPPHHPYLTHYINLVKQDELLSALEASLVFLSELSVSDFQGKELYSYADGKWTVQEVLQHIIDTERVMTYRAMRFARKDATELPGFDENSFSDNSFANMRSMQNILDELVLMRKSTIALYQSFNEEQLLFLGTANGNKNCAATIGFFTIGHALHHLNVLQERYGIILRYSHQ